MDVKEFQIVTEFIASSKYIPNLFTWYGQIRFNILIMKSQVSDNELNHINMQYVH